MHDVHDASVFSSYSAQQGVPSDGACASDVSASHPARLLRPLRLPLTLAHRLSAPLTAHCLALLARPHASRC